MNEASTQSVFQLEHRNEQVLQFHAMLPWSMMQASRVHELLKRPCQYAHLAGYVRHQCQSPVGKVVRQDINKSEAKAPAHESGNGIAVGSN